MYLANVIQALQAAGHTYSILSKKETLQYALNLPPTHPTEREAYLLLTPTETVLYHSPFVIPPTDPNVVSIAMSPDQPLSTVLKRYFQDASVIGIEAENLTVAEHQRLRTLLESPVKCEPVDHITKTVRLVKTEHEITFIKNAVSITKKTLNWVHNFIMSSTADNITEVQLKHLINQQMITFGADESAFPSIVAFDSHTASPHHIPTTRKLKSTSIVLIDIGAKYKGYCGDMTRTWQRGTPSAQFLQIERIVHKAYKSAYQQVKQARTTPTHACDIDAAARFVINHAGFGSMFIHTTGHGIGLEAHEAPGLSSQNDQLLQKNMAITIEPGIYLPNTFGYRHENTVIL